MKAFLIAGLPVIPLETLAFPEHPNEKNGGVSPAVLIS
jgi:hypothetical protein